MGGSLWKNSSTGIGTAAAKVRVKSGCGTCKIRKVKCDEGRPACQRCVTTGRSCDGYGIWGGGGSPSSYSRRPGSIISPKDSDCSDILPYQIDISIAASIEEQGYFEWFRLCSAAKLTGVFCSSFWDTLVLQGSSNELAVFHAVLALSTVHRMEIREINSHGESNIVPDKKEQFMLRQYSKAISHLRPHFSTQSRTSTRVALITCIVFTTLEFLRGRHKTAQVHLHNGLKLLREFRSCSTSADVVDVWIIEEFARIHVQVELLHHTHHHEFITLGNYKPEPLTPTFQTMNEARCHLDRLQGEIFYLTEKGRQQEISTRELLPPELLDRQRRILADLSSWLTTYKSSKAILQAPMPVRDKFAYELLNIYHTMADIMAHACLQPACESIFDSHANDFTSIITRSLNIHKNASITSKALFGHRAALPCSIADKGWIAPLYYTALKCRIHRIRLQAIKMLNSTSHREGIWESNIAACIARKVMEIEERDFYKDLLEGDGFHFSSCPEERDFLLTPLPNSYRIHEVQVLLPDDPLGTITLLCRQRQHDGSWDILVSEYDILAQRWIDEEGRRSTF